MIDSALQFIELVLIPLGVFGVFMATFLEEVIAPIPSALVLTLAGFIFLQGPFSTDLLLKLIFVVVLPSALGVTIGSFFIYGIAYWSGKPVLEKWGKWLGLSWTDVEKIQTKFDGTKKDEIILFVLRTIPIIPSVAISAFFGLVRFNVKKYFILTFLGTCIRSFILGLVGWQVGALYHTYADKISHIEKYVFLGFGLAIFAFLAYKISQKKVV